MKRNAKNEKVIFLVIAAGGYNDHQQAAGTTRQPEGVSVSFIF
jgi:hypothetical protein